MSSFVTVAGGFRSSAESTARTFRHAGFRVRDDAFPAAVVAAEPAAQGVGAVGGQRPGSGEAERVDERGVSRAPSRTGSRKR